MFVHDSKPINRKLKINQSNRESKVKTIDFCNEMEKMILSFLHLIIVEDRHSEIEWNFILVPESFELWEYSIVGMKQIFNLESTTGRQQQFLGFLLMENVFKQGAVSFLYRMVKSENSNGKLKLLISGISVWDEI
uniref:Uncharacterized protein n=1 Tax=Solanum lycopersicum TaxID=4081 RepID=A0A3Q7EIL2_SOLLC